MPTPQEILRDIARIPRMERGALCRMREGANGPYFNHQTWEKGRNVVRYVPRDRAAAIREAIAGYRRFLLLTEAYAERIIRRTRKKHAPPPRAPRRNRPA